MGSACGVVRRRRRVAKCLERLCIRPPVGGRWLALLFVAWTLRSHPLRIAAKTRIPRIVANRSVWRSSYLLHEPGFFWWVRPTSVGVPFQEHHGSLSEGAYAPTVGFVQFIRVIRVQFVQSE